MSSSSASASWGERPRTPERRSQPLSASTQYGVRGHADSSGLELGLSLPRSSRPRPRSSTPIPVFEPSSPRAVLRSLQVVLERDGVQLGECVNTQGVLERWAIHSRLQSAMALEGFAGQEGAIGKTFGSPVSVAVKCASMPTVLGGFQHPIPWIVYACIEELNRTGIYQPGLFRAAPHRSRLEKLISGFDCALRSSKLDPDFESLCPPCPPTASSTLASLRKESMADICALLKSYLDSLPEPLIHENITAALHRLCVMPSDKRELEKSQGDGCFRHPPSISHRASAALTHSRTSSNPTTASPKSPSPLMNMTHSEKRSADLSLEDVQVHIAQHLLHLTAPAHCSLFAYLCGFFTQLPLSPDNGLALDDVSRIFGRSLAGGPASMRNAVLMWLLERWPRVADGLFDVFSAGSDEDEVVATSAYLPLSSPLARGTDSASAQSPDSTPSLPHLVSALRLSIAKVRRQSSLISLDGAESVFSASTVESDDGPVHGVLETELEELRLSESGNPTLNGKGGVKNSTVALSSTQVHSPGSSSQVPPAKLDTDAGPPNSVDLKPPAISDSRTDDHRAVSDSKPASNGAVED
ncbi:hypothetical protein V8D89_000271 [Ganoderma adspersum]